MLMASLRPVMNEVSEQETGLGQILHSPRTPPKQTLCLPLPHPRQTLCCLLPQLSQILLPIPIRPA